MNLNFAIIVSPFLLASICSGQTTDRVSVSSQGVEGDDLSHAVAISDNGRFVAFDSGADNLVPNDTSGHDVFVRDLQTGSIERVSVSSQGTEGNGHSNGPSISANGRYVAFFSTSSDLVPNDLNGVLDVFLHDRQSGVTERVSVDSLGGEGNGWSFQPSISASGRYVAFESRASNLVVGDTNSQSDIFIRDMLTGITKRVSVDSLGIEGDNFSTKPSISGNGRYVAFHSISSNLVPGDLNGFGDIFVRDTQAGLTRRVSIDSLGIEGNSTSNTPSISASGRFVAFESKAGNLVTGDTNGHWDVFVHDLQMATTDRVSLSTLGVEGNKLSTDPSISSNGDFVVFYSHATNLAPNDLNLLSDVFVHERQTGVTERISVSSDGVEGDDNSYHAAISAGGRFVVFSSLAANLVPNDMNGYEDIFFHDRWNGLGANSIYLTGPSSSYVGVPLNLSWAVARPNSDYWLIYSINTVGSTVGGHAINLGPPLSVIATGINSATGVGSYSWTSVPSWASGRTLYFEIVARDANGVVFDSNALPVFFF